MLSYLVALIAIFFRYLQFGSERDNAILFGSERDNAILFGQML